MNFPTQETIDKIRESSDKDGYFDLDAVVNTDDERWDINNWRKFEVEVLQPELEALGLVVMGWRNGEADSFGPLTRVAIVGVGQDTFLGVYG